MRIEVGEKTAVLCSVPLLALCCAARWASVAWGVGVGAVEAVGIVGVEWEDSPRLAGRGPQSGRRPGRSAAGWSGGDPPSRPGLRSATQR